MTTEALSSVDDDDGFVNAWASLDAETRAALPTAEREKCRRRYNKLMGKIMARPRADAEREAWRPIWVRGSALLEAKLPEIQFRCSPWIPEGVMIIAGRPKLGKTSVARQWAVCVANGLDLWGRPCAASPVLFLSLEEGEKLMRRKLLAAGYDGGVTRNIFLSFQWRQGVQGVADIEEFMRDEPDVRLIVIDSLTRFRAPATKDKSSFVQDYEAISGLSDFAKTVPGLAIVVIHHTTKLSNAGDPIADISGTFGLSAAADSYAVLRKEGPDFVLHCGGRYWDEPEDSFILTRDNGRWQMAGAHDGIALTPMQSQYLHAIVDAGTVTGRGLAARLGRKENSVSEILKELNGKGVVERTPDGWRATPIGERKCATST